MTCPGLTPPGGSPYDPPTMASLTVVTDTKRRNKKKKAGRARKAKMGQRSTLSYAEVFAGCGEPKDAAPADAPTQS